jgi:Rrf2 family transcriptional regulator, iron-sulfur cluster assembly transcription factor
MLSSSCKYAIRAGIYIALNSEEHKRIGIKKISEELGLPAPFMSKILQLLARKGILVSTKGPNGGFNLGRPADRIRLMEIIEVIDGPEAFNRCVIGVRSCGDQNKYCAFHEKYSGLRNEMREMFRRETLESLVQDIRDGKQTVIL